MRNLLIIGLLFSGLLYAQNLNTHVEKLCEEPELKHALLGFCAMEVESGTIIADHQMHKSLIPASSLKVVTTATALGVLGKDYRFKTELAYTGTIDASGVLHGDIIIKGYGDPTLGSDQFDKAMPLDELGNQFVKVIMDAGIKQVDGRIIGDGTFFESQVTPSAWQWNDLGNYFAAGVFGLNIHENLYHLTFQQSPNLGATPPIINVEPKIPGLSFINELSSAPKGTGDNAYIFGAPYTYNRYVRGTIPIGNEAFRIKGSIPEPPLFAAYLLKQALNYVGVETKEHTCIRHLEQRPDAGKVIYTHESPRLEEIILRTNMKSVNLYCEVLLKAIGQKQKGQGSLEGGLESIKEYWTNKKIDLSGLHMQDGSGLSPRNAVSSYSLAAIMRASAKDDAFMASLPLAGKTGSLRNMFKGTIAENNIRAKSGYMGHIMSYTGYATNKAGKLISFSVIVNNYYCPNSEMRKNLENIMLKIVE